MNFLGSSWLVRPRHTVSSGWELGSAEGIYSQMLVIVGDSQVSATGVVGWSKVEEQHELVSPSSARTHFISLGLLKIIFSGVSLHICCFRSESIDISDYASDPAAKASAGFYSSRVVGGNYILLIYHLFLLFDVTLASCSMGLVTLLQRLSHNL